MTLLILFILAWMHCTATNDNIITNQISENNQNKSLDHCVVCMVERPFTTFDEQSFKSQFKFYCSHASIDICTNCWRQISNQSNGNPKCPLCRSCRYNNITQQSTLQQPVSRLLTMNTEPYGHRPSSSQPGYLSSHDLQSHSDVEVERTEINYIDRFCYPWIHSIDDLPQINSFTKRYIQGSAVIIHQSWRQIVVDIVCLHCLNCPLSLILGSIGIGSACSSCMIGIPATCGCFCDCVCNQQCNRY